MQFTKKYLSMGHQDTDFSFKLSIKTDWDFKHQTLSFTSGLQTSPADFSIALLRRTNFILFIHHIWEMGVSNFSVQCHVQRVYATCRCYVELYLIYVKLRFSRLAEVNLEKYFKMLNPNITYMKYFVLHYGLDSLAAFMIC